MLCGCLYPYNMDHKLILFLASVVSVYNTVSANDPPTITCPKNFIVREDFIVGKKIFNCSAIDKDDNDTADGTIGYNFFVGNQARMFSVDADTCDVYLVQPFEYSNANSYTLTLKATDGGGLSDDCTFILSILDVNNNAPSCNQSLVWGSLFENAPNFTSFGKLSCKDKDTGSGGTLYYSVILGNSSNSRSDTIGVNATGSVIILRQIDYDTEPDTFQAYVEVRDGGSPVMSTTVTAILSLKDVDDNPPKYTNLPYQGDVDEHAKLGTTVIRINATDADQPNTPRSQIAFTSSCTPDWLVVDRSSGDLFVVKDVDWEQAQVITCTISAASVSSTTSTATVTVTVNDINDGIPSFSQTFYNAHVFENAPADTTIISVTASDPEKTTIKYSMDSAFFDIDPNNGDVKIKSPPDYETQTSHLVSITATDSGTPPQMTSVFLQLFGLPFTGRCNQLQPQVDFLGNFTFSSFPLLSEREVNTEFNRTRWERYCYFAVNGPGNVSITPINEFAPEFLKECSGNVAENSLPGTSILTLSARDNDTGLDGIIMYKFASNNNLPFFIDASSGLIGVDSNIDYETNPSFTFTVVAYDKSITHTKSATQKCTITVMDVNDQSVECSPTPVTTVQNPFPLQQKVTQVNCTGSKKGASLAYAFTAGNDGTFKINPNTGEVTLESIPLKQQYNLNVSVTSGADVTNTTLIVFTEQKLNFTNLPATINITENVPGRLMFTVQACCAFPKVEYALVSGNDDQIVTLTKSNGEARYMRPYDRETQAMYLYQFTARSDSGQTATGTLTVYVNDVNDNSPQFSGDVSEINVEETWPTSSPPIQNYPASDKDEGVNAELTYSISSGNTDNTFTIDNTGSLSLGKALNHAVQDTYQLQITAVDNGSPPHTGTILVIVHVVDKNQNQPQLVPVGGPFSAVLGEDAALGTTVFALQATDNDTMSTFRYGILSGNIDNAFQVDPANGTIRLVRTLDRERTSYYSLAVSATNQNGVVANGTLNINVTDVNDNNPVFTPSVIVVRLPDKTQSRAFVADLTVTDADFGVNATVTLTIDGGNTANAFKLTDKHLETNNVMNYPACNWYRVIIQAEDGGSPKRTAKAMVVVYVLNGNIPYFNVSSATITMQEGRNSGYEVYDLNATDMGAVEDGNLVYKIISGNTNNDFLVRITTGEIIIRNDLDFERTEVYNLEITAANPTPSNPEVTFTLTVSVGNVNEADPVFVQYSLSFTVQETAAPNTIVGTVLATDTDHGQFGVVTENMTGPQGFKIDRNTGTISVSGALDYLVRQYYTYTITAADGGTPPRLGIASIVILIEDVNNHHPYFTSDTVVNVLDSVPIGSKIYHTNANDLDTGPAGNVSYELVNPTSLNTFFLDPYTGILTTKELLDALTTPSYTLTIRAFDAGIVSLDNTTSVQINVIPTNPNYYDPVFSTACSTSAHVLRKSPIATTVWDCSAIDLDKGISGELGYTIISGNDDGFFFIDYNSGEITTIANLQPAKNSYTFLIQVKDKGVPSRNATMTIVVTINPAITKDLKIYYNFTIPENASLSSQVGIITVDDGRSVSSYSITSGNYNDAFDITNGKLTVKTNLDRETYSLYALEISVKSDAADENIFVEVVVTDVNDNLPIFTIPALNLAIAENSPIGQTIATISYTDEDTDAVNRNNILSIAPPGSSLFDIDQAGHLFIKAVPDYETISPKQQTFSIMAAEQQWQYKTVTLPVTIDILDVEEKEEKSTSDITDDALISLEVPYQASVGHTIYTLKPGDFGIIPTGAANIRYVSYKTGPCRIDESTGDIKVSGPLGLWTKYFVWAMIQVTEGGITTSKTSLVRIDTFDLNSQSAVIEFADSYSYMLDHVKQFRYRAQQFFSATQRIGFSNLLDTSTGSRRRLLALKTAAYTYVVNDTSADKMSNVNNPKYFMSEEQILRVLQHNPDGTPVAGLSDPSVADVETVEPYEGKETATGFDAFIKSPAGIAVFCLLALLLLVLLILLLTCIFYRKCYNKRSKTKKAKDKEIQTERAKKKSFSKVEDPTSIFNSNPHIIVSAPPLLTHQTPPPEKPSPQADNEPTTTAHPDHNDPKKQNNEAIKKGLPSQYNGKNGKNKPGKTQIINVSKSN